MTGVDRRRAHLWVTGTVQGVGFRYFAKQTARALGLGGSARNLRDGGVEIVVEGPASAVDAFVARVRAGPGGARVRGVQVEWEAPSGTGEFVIR